MCMGVLEAEMKEKIRKEYFRRTRKLFETKLCNRKLIKGINSLTVPLSTTMHKALHLRDDIDRHYVSRKKEEEDSRTLKIALINQYKNSRTISKRAKKD